MRAKLVLLFAAASLVACGGNSAETSTSVYKSAGSVQCSGGGSSLSSMERQLADAGIQLFAAACGNDGMIYPAVCGAPDGRIGIFEIGPSQIQAASALGFAPLSNLPSATKVACPAGA